MCLPLGGLGTYASLAEITVSKGQHYLTIVMDLVSEVVVFVGDAKEADVLRPFLKRLRPRCAPFKAVAMDMSDLPDGQYEQQDQGHEPPSVRVSRI